MRVSWIIADDFTDPTIESSTLKNIGSIWGSWRTWRAWNTDNVVCYDASKAKELVKRAFQAVCNLYVPQKAYVELGRPNSVKLFNGEFPTDFDNAEEIISMHLIAESNDLVLLLGYNLSEPLIEDVYEKHKRKNYLSAFASALKMYPDTQWVVLDHDEDLADNFLEIENITCDTYKNVLELLG